MENNTSDNLKKDETAIKYSIEDILEMLCGHQYYDDDTIKFIFYKVNGNKEEADYYLNICLEKAAKLHALQMKLKTIDEIESDEAVTNVEELNETEN